MLQSYLWDYSDGYILLEGTITVIDPKDVNYKKKLAFKKYAPFISCIIKINNALIDNAEYLGIAMPISSNVNEVIRAILDFFIYKSILHAQQTKTKKTAFLCAQKRSKGKKLTYSLICVLCFCLVASLYFWCFWCFW